MGHPTQFLVSIVVPVWRDTDALIALLNAMPPRPDTEVLVATTADAITDVERAVTGRPDVRAISTRRGRGTQMNAGARHANGTWLLFLHADSRLAEGAVDEIISLSSDARTVGGSFRFALDASGWRPRLLEWGTAQRTRWLQLPYGDQGIFVRRSVFEHLGGYIDAPLMEDVDLVRRLRRMGRLHRSSRSVTTSARRWLRDGWFRRTFGNWLLLSLYFAGADPRRLARRYERRSRSAVALFARAPSTGGKSRLFYSLGMAPDPALPAALLADSIAAVRRVADADPALIFTPAENLQEFRALTDDGWILLPQSGADIGDRMAAAFQELHALGYERVALIGSDVPTLPAAAIADALRALRTRQRRVVLGPAHDGGYYLIGLQAPADELFRGIDWSTPRVLEQTCARARDLGTAVYLLPRWYDVDDADSLRRAIADAPDSRLAEWWRTHAAQRRRSPSP